MELVDNLKAGFIDVDRVVINGIAAVLMELLELLVLWGVRDFLEDFCPFHFVIL